MSVSSNPKKTHATQEQLKLKIDETLTKGKQAILNHFRTNGEFIKAVEGMAAITAEFIDLTPTDNPISFFLSFSFSKRKQNPLVINIIKYLTNTVEYISVKNKSAKE